MEVGWPTISKPGDVDMVTSWSIPLAPVYTSDISRNAPRRLSFRYLIRRKSAATFYRILKQMSLVSV